MQAIASQIQLLYWNLPYNESNFITALIAIANLLSGCITQLQPPVFFNQALFLVPADRQDSPVYHR